MRVRLKGEFGEVEVESEPKNLLNINRQPTIVGDDAAYRAVDLYKTLKKISEGEEGEKP